MPERQGKGLGSKIIAETLKQPPLNACPVFVLGEPAYYSKFNFQRVNQPDVYI
ncbi:MAG: hypothetical protein ABSA97_09890 [Verrucomicrobiia bacterium]|jgi:putative acetyltransferase